MLFIASVNSLKEQLSLEVTTFACRHMQFLTLTILLLCLGSMPVGPPVPECNTTFQAVLLENHIIQLQWDPVRTNLSECPDIVYCVSYRCCSDMSWQFTRCTTNTTIKFQLSKEQCEIENQAVFSVQVEGSNYLSNMTVNLENSTGVKGS